MSNLPGTTATTAAITIGQSYSNSLGSTSDIDWIRLSGALNVYNPAFNFSSTADLSTAEVVIYRFSNWSQTWQRNTVNLQDLSEALAWLEGPSASETVYVGLTGFVGTYTVSLANSETIIAGLYDDYTSDRALAVGATLTGTLDHSDDRDYFRVTGQDQHYYRVRVTLDPDMIAAGVGAWVSASAFSGSYTFVETANGGYLETVFKWTKPQFSTEFSVTVGSSYNELLNTFSDFGYSVNVTDLGLSIGTPNTTAATALSIAVNSTFHDVTEADYAPQFYSFQAEAGKRYIVSVNDSDYRNNWAPDLSNLTASYSGGATVIGTAVDNIDMNYATTAVLGQNATVTFSIRGEYGSNYDWNQVHISVLEVVDTAGDTLETAAALTLNQTRSEAHHFGDMDFFRLNVAAGEFYTVRFSVPDMADGTVSGSAGMNWFQNAAGEADYTVWGENYSRRNGYLDVQFVALETGYVNVGFNTSQSWTITNSSGSIAYWATPETENFTYTVTATAGYYDDRAEAWSDLCGPMQLNTLTNALDHGTDVDGFAFEVTAGQSYDVLVQGNLPWIDLYHDADLNGSPNSYYNNLNRPWNGYGYGPSFAEMQATLTNPFPNFLNAILIEEGGIARLTFTATYTGTAWINVGNEGTPAVGGVATQYQVYVGEGGTPAGILTGMGLGSNAVDTYVGTVAANQFYGLGGNDNLKGGAGNDTLFGGEGNDMIHGGLGDDSLNGGAGVDTVYYRDSAGITLNLGLTTAQATGQGSDIVLNFENIVTGTGDDMLTGTTLGNVIVSDAGNDSISGGDGNDILSAESGNDSLDGGAGNDRIDGGDGLDWLSYAGSTQLVIDLNLTAAQWTGLGRDTLVSIENVTSGTGDDRLTGNALNNRLHSGAGSDRLYGLGGDDTLSGGSGIDILEGGTGNDRLYGGASSDYFVFNTALGTSNIDRIHDFNTTDDFIRLDDAIFNALTVGRLQANTFTANTSGEATDGLDRIIYETDTGRLLYDLDGTGAATAVQFALLSPGLALSALDFYVI